LSCVGPSSTSFEKEIGEEGRYSTNTHLSNIQEVGDTALADEKRKERLLTTKAPSS